MPETNRPPINTSPTVLCIAGLDPSGGAGLGADIRACKAMGALALPVATAIVVQNTRGVKLSQAISLEVLVAQIETLLEDIHPSAIKIGMLPGAEAARAVANLLRPLHGQIPIVMDTVFAPSSGRAFNDEDAIATIADELLPLATVVTPNALEARLLGADAISDINSMQRAAQAVHGRTGAQAVLVKGGHTNDPHFAVDLLFDGTDFLELRAPRQGSYEVRGTGCLLASALASGLAQGLALSTAAHNAKEWLTQEYLKARAIGGGRRIAAI